MIVVNDKVGLIMKLGQRLQEDRNQKSWTQERLAETLNISTQELSKWEASNGYPNIDQLIQISNLFELSLDTLIKDDSDLKSKIAIGKHQSKTTNAWGYAIHWLDNDNSGYLLNYENVN